MDQRVVHWILSGKDWACTCKKCACLGKGQAYLLLWARSYNHNADGTNPEALQVFSLTFTPL